MRSRRYGFTLIELPIVLVIIGLIVGGVLVGRDLIAAAATRAQISQIERYQQAVNTFRGKYNYLPGDMPSTTATSFGFSRGSSTGCDYPVNNCGNNDGLIGNFLSGDNSQTGEAHLFWLDLKQANLIADSSITMAVFGAVETNVGNWLPPAKLAAGMYVYVWYGGVLVDYLQDATLDGDAKNYLSVSGVSGFTGYMGNYSQSTVRVSDAYNIDKKEDDGKPQSGSVKAMYVTYLSGGSLKALWSRGANRTVELGNPPSLSATAGSSTSCYDNNNVNGAEMAYSIGQSNGSGGNCALSFRLQ